MTLRVILGFVSSNCQLVSVSITAIFYCKVVLHLISKLSCFSFNQSNLCMVSEMHAYMCEEFKILLFVVFHISM